MNICLECGGPVKLITKAGRLIWSDDELYEIPSECKIPTCIKCGQSVDDPFVEAKIQKIIVGQKKINPGYRLVLLRWIDRNLRKSIEETEDPAVLYSDTILSLAFREVVLNKTSYPKDKIVKFFRTFIKNYYPDVKEPVDIDKILDSVSDMEKFAEIMQVFCDVWVFTNQ